MKKIILLFLCCLSVFSYSQFGYRLVSGKTLERYVIDTPSEPSVKKKAQKVNIVPVVYSQGDKLLLELMDYIKYNKLKHLKCYFFDSNWTHKFKFIYKNRNCELCFRDKNPYVKYGHIIYQKNLNSSILYKSEVAFVVDYFKFDKTAKWITIY